MIGSGSIVGWYVGSLPCASAVTESNRGNRQSQAILLSPWTPEILNAAGCAAPQFYVPSLPAPAPGARTER